MPSMRKLAISGFLFLMMVLRAFPSLGQDGCTDPLATNYQSGATINDGSCLYPDTDYTLTQLGALPGSVRECSGLTWKDGQLWAQNDGGNTPAIYQLDTLNGSIQRSIRLAPGNWDWEDLASSEEYLFIGDFGNNDGSRQNLQIYRLTNDQLLQDTIWTVDTITFAFADQVDFNPANFDTPYDCEAFFCWQDSLHVFTKDWVDGQTKHYVFPAIPGHYNVSPRDSFDVQGLITGASIAPDGVVSILGYNAMGSFVWFLFDYQPGALFSGHKRKIDLGTFTTLGQTEGIAFSRSGEGFIASEEVLAFPAQLFSFTSRQWTDPSPTRIGSFSPKPIAFSPNPFSDRLSVENLERGVVELNLYDLVGQRVARKRLEGRSRIDWLLQGLVSGYYTLVVEQEGRRQTFRILKAE